MLEIIKDLISKYAGKFFSFLIAWISGKAYAENKINNKNDKISKDIKNISLDVKSKSEKDIDKDMNKWIKK